MNSRLCVSTRVFVWMCLVASRKTMMRFYGPVLLLLLLPFSWETTTSSVPRLELGNTPRLNTVVQNIATECAEVWRASRCCWLVLMDFYYYWLVDLLALFVCTTPPLRPHSTDALSLFLSGLLSTYYLSNRPGCGPFFEEGEAIK